MIKSRLTFVEYFKNHFQIINKYIQNTTILVLFCIISVISHRPTIAQHYCRSSLILFLFCKTYLLFLILLNYLFPMSLQVFHKIIQSSAFLLKNYTPNLPIESQPNLKTLIQSLNALQLQALGLDKSQGLKEGIGVRNIFEKRGLRVTLYFLPQGQVMQLHNHPNMLVITYILKGALEANAYSPVTANLTFKKQTIHLQPASVSFIDGFRTNERNLHELRGIEGTYFIDILFPDYGQGRECLFFEEEKQLLDERWKLRQVQPRQLQFFAI